MSHNSSDVCSFNDKCNYSDEDVCNAEALVFLTLIDTKLWDSRTVCPVETLPLAPNTEPEQTMAQ